MFALAIWDAPRRRLILGRDRLGQKPLIYRLDRGRISFASELKSLLALPEADLPRRIDPLALDRYLTYGYVPHPSTILEGVHKLPPAHYGVWQEGRLELTRYWDPDWNLEVDRPPGEDVEELRATLDDAVREQMVADVPLGAFLSGGIDSSIIVGLMQRASDRPVKTFSIGFPEAAFDESHYAELVAKSLGTEHHTFIMEPHAWETLPALAQQFDEPFADSSSLPTLVRLRGETREHVTVALTGDAGDELFAGYDRPYRARGRRRLARPPRPKPPGGSSARPVARALPTSVKSKTLLLQKSPPDAGRDRPGGPSPATSAGSRCSTSPPAASLYSDDFLDHLSRAAARHPLEDDRPRLEPGPGLRRRPQARPGLAGHDRRPAHLPARRPARQGRHGQHGQQPRVPGTIPRPPGGRSLAATNAMPIRRKLPCVSEEVAPRSSSSRPSPTSSPGRSRPGPRWDSASRSTAGSATS